MMPKVGIGAYEPHVIFKDSKGVLSFCPEFNFSSTMGDKIDTCTSFYKALYRLSQLQQEQVK